jgi:hypothetical protein
LLKANGPVAFGTDANYGFFIDDITIANSSELITPTVTTLPSTATSFTLNATTAGAALVNGTQYFMHIRPNVGCKWFGYGTLKAVTATAPTGYAAWIANYPGASVAPGFQQDPDVDGIANGVEYVLGNNPSTSSTGLYQVSSTGTSVKFRHTQTNVLATNVSIFYQWSTDLQNWHASGATNAGGTSASISTSTVVNTSAPSLDVIEVTTTITGGPSKRLYARMVTTAP